MLSQVEAPGLRIKRSGAWQEEAAADMASLTGLELRAVSKSYADALVCRETSLSIAFGEFVCFLGPSGCGKTTLLRMIAGLTTPSGGRILMGGKDITDVPTHERNFGMVFQSLALFPHLSVEANIAYALKVRGVPRRERQRRVQALLELIRLPDMAGRSIGALSGGQRQRVAIARALAQEPALFLLDEPLSALDAKLRDHMQVELKLLQRKLKVTTILVTHDQREAMTIADRIVVMADGCVQQIGTPTEIYRRPANRFVADFIGQNNLLEVEAVDHTHARFGATLLDLGDMPATVRPGQRLTLSVRPEDVVVGPADAAPPGCAGSIPGKIVFMRDLGASVELHVACGDQVILCTTPASHRSQGTDGTQDHVHLRRGSCLVHLD